MAATGVGLAVAGGVGGFLGQGAIRASSTEQRETQVRNKADVASGKLTAAEILAMPEHDQEMLRRPVSTDGEINVGASMAAGFLSGALFAGSGIGSIVAGTSGHGKAGVALLGASVLGLGGLVGTIAGGITEAVRS